MKMYNFNLYDFFPFLWRKCFFYFLARKMSTKINVKNIQRHFTAELLGLEQICIETNV